jgi:hypothetical protein
MARVFKQCAQARGNSSSSGFLAIKIPLNPDTHPKECTKWKALDCPEEMEQALLTRNRSLFRQSQGTPFTVPPLSHQINFRASTETVELILNGNYSNEELDTITKMLLEHMKKVSKPVITSTFQQPNSEARFCFGKNAPPLLHQVSTWATAKVITPLTPTRKKFLNTTHSNRKDKLSSRLICPF